MDDIDIGIPDFLDRAAPAAPTQEDPEPATEESDAAENPRAVAGDNSKPRAGGIASDQLKSIVERIERLAEEKQALADDIKEVLMEAKSNGFDTKTIRKAISLRKQDANERAEQEALLETYLLALGMI
jgi:uncharacterized protein (UPF0335 family)